ncbi:MAG TPA: DNA translocase FtsK 4TM domain-containing protein, partial [Candidatus Binatia bacterium]|nr:DNA translocase FtsK 4TM domain-containing protein [Candidatus Binatia bacterium]
MASAPSAGRHFLREAEGLAGGAVALFVALALVSYSPDLPRQNLGGPVGHLLADTVLRALGVAAYLFPVYLGFVAVALLRRNGDDLGGARLGGAVLLIGGVAAIAGLIAGGKATVRGGGWLGGFLG